MLCDFFLAYSVEVWDVYANVKYHTDMYTDAVVYQVTRLPRSPDQKPLVLAITSKKSAQRLVAALAEQEGRIDACQITMFRHPEFSFLRE
jgi:hypothetical protein